MVEKKFDRNNFNNSNNSMLVCNIADPSCLSREARGETITTIRKLAGNSGTVAALPLAHKKEP